MTIYPLPLILILVNKLNIQEDQIKDSSHIMEDLGADSLTFVEIIIEVEEEFDIQISDEELDSILTVKQLKDYIKENR